MKHTISDYLFGFITGAALMVILLMGIIPADPTISKSRIIPDLKIEIADGIADTTYIYKVK